jgi:hypothetical protein
LGAASPLTFYSLGAQQSAGTPSSALGFTAFRFTKAIDEVLSGRLWIALHDRKTLGTVTIAAQGGATYTLFDTHVTEIEIVAEKLGGCRLPSMSRSGSRRSASQPLRKKRAGTSSPTLALEGSRNVGLQTAAGDVHAAEDGAAASTVMTQRRGARAVTFARICKPFQNTRPRSTQNGQRCGTANPDCPASAAMRGTRGPSS